MTFRITQHARHDAPPDAVDRLLAQLQGRRSNGRFRKVGSEIRVSWGHGEGSAWERPERQELEREEVLQLLRDTCDGASELQVDWYAVGPLG